MQREFVLHVVSGMRPADAARRAGYVGKNLHRTLYNLLRKPHVIAAMKEQAELRRPLIQKDDDRERWALELAFQALTDGLQDDDALVRVKSAETLARLLPRLRRHRPKVGKAARCQPRGAA